MVSTAPHLIRFADRRSAYSVVAELRRLYELDRFVGLQVQPVFEGVVVEVPGPGYEAEMIAIAERHGGRLAAAPREADGRA